MKVDISINPKTTDALIRFDFENINDIKDMMDSVAILSMVAGDYSLDPELDLEDFQSLVSQGKEAGNSTLIFDINEAGIEAEFSK